jgi:hypothetical protein
MKIISTEALRFLQMDLSYFVTPGPFSPCCCFHMKGKSSQKHRERKQFQLKTKFRCAFSSNSCITNAEASKIVL